jgi:hypothetical protein
MTRDEVLERIGSLGFRLSPRGLRDFVDEGFVPGPVRGPQDGSRAPNWQWSTASYRRALQTCRLKARGTKRSAQIRVLLWLRGREPFSEKIRGDLLDEFKRLRKRVIKRMPTDTGPSETDQLRRLNTLSRQMGEPSPLLLPEGVTLSK